MPELRFYHLQTQSALHALPVLLEKALQKQEPILFKVPDSKALREWDDYLWSFSPDKFIPHGMGDDDHAERQPIWVTDQLQDNPNQSKMLISVDMGIGPDVCKEFDLVCLMFEERQGEQIEAARQLWAATKELQSSGAIERTYWKQSPQGAWEKQAV